MSERLLLGLAVKIPLHFIKLKVLICIISNGQRYFCLSPTNKNSHMHSQSIRANCDFLASFGGENVFINNLCMVDGCQAVILDLQGVRAD